MRRLNPKLSKPVMQVTLSLPPGEHLSKDKWMEMTHECAKDMGFENNQFIAIYHKDTSHDHLNIVANRVGFDMRTVSDSKSYKNRLSGKFLKFAHSYF
ncbi:MAG: relaxase/mobilization nuclease domain-containing protein [Chitinophagaceae bacterium]